VSDGFRFFDTTTLITGTGCFVGNVTVLVFKSQKSLAHRVPRYMGTDVFATLLPTFAFFDTSVRAFLRVRSFVMGRGGLVGVRSYTSNNESE